MSEQALVEAAKQDPSCFAALYEAHFERIYAFVARRVRDRSIAEDLTAEVFRRALAAIVEFEWRGVPFVAWLVRIAANEVADHAAKAARERGSIAADEPARDDTELVEHRATLFRLVDDLPVDQRRVIVMRFGEERSIRVPGKEDTMETVATVTGVRPYLIVRGADELIAFLQQTFDAELVMRAPTPDGKVMHAEVRVGDSPIEMGDAGAQWQPLAAPLHVYIENVDETYRRAIAAGATSLYAPIDQPYGDREAGVRDRRGIEWFLATRLEGGPRPEGFGTVTTGFRATGARQMAEFLEKAFGAVHVSGSMEHAEIRLGETMIELSEAHGQWGPTRGVFHLFVSDCDAVYEEALRAGATSIWAPEDKPYGERSAGVTDAWGNQWYIATPLAR
ncbi:MAG: sigma-70 family RNA polymerase sigma factor [Thermoanaerobaculia bacterium]